MRYRNEKLEPYVEGEPYFYLSPNGYHYWCNAIGQFHREDGPAVEWRDGRKEWFYNHVQFEEEYWAKMKELKLGKFKNQPEEIQTTHVCHLCNGTGKINSPITNYDNHHDNEYGNIEL